MINEKARWIWLDEQILPDQYISFFQEFSCKKEKTVLKISAETNYIAYLNGKRVGFGQFAGYKNEKYYDELDITDFVKEGKNKLTVTVWYEGVNSATHIADRGGLIFAVCQGDRLVARSSQNTLCGLHTGYIQGRKKNITVQLGLTSGMIFGGEEIVYQKSKEVELTYNILPRPVKKLEEEDIALATPITVNGKTVYDLSRETVGYLFLRVECKDACAVKVAYGEHIKDGGVRQIIGGRDFSLDFECKKGENHFEQLFVRVACRYLEVIAPDGVTVKEVGMIPVRYPQTQKPRFLSGLDGDIYDVCVRTLELCMHEHYEDCPWREQALYVLDSRNQMLCGYYAFEGSSFQRENLIFISKGRRSDGLLELTYPAVDTPAIPFFSVMYPVAVYEYIEHTGDKSILPTVMPTMKGIMSFFKHKIGDNRLIGCLPRPYWNFYEWTDGSDGTSSDTDVNDLYNKGLTTDLILNCAFIYSCQRFKKLCEITGDSFEVALDGIKKAIIDNFYDIERGIYFLCKDGQRKFSQLGNAFAMLVGLDGKNLLSAVKGEGVIPASLSMIGYVYDSILKTEGGEEFVLNDIRRKYSYMLSEGATSVWETILGDADFDNAGSLCHGWSAMPVYYYNKILKRD